MKRVLATASIVLLLVVASVAVAGGDHSRAGKITDIDQTAQMLTVQGEKGDQWTLYWTETTKLKDDLTVQELKVGDTVHFDFVEKDGKKWVTELRRTARAK